MVPGSNVDSRCGWDDWGGRYGIEEVKDVVVGNNVVLVLRVIASGADRGNTFRRQISSSRTNIVACDDIVVIPDNIGAVRDSCAKQDVSTRCPYRDGGRAQNRAVGHDVVLR